jgi:methylated-DNA-[protein]-cysteine S-methyltransferase
MNQLTAACVSTADGDFTILADEDAVLASGWTTDIGLLIDLIHPTMRPDTVPVAVNNISEVTSALARAIAAVAAYYDGDLAAPSAVPVHQRSGTFRIQAWDTLRRVRPGERLTYSQFAERAGRPAAVRAAAAACAKNAVGLFVPCHRIVRSDGRLGGFRYGLARKQQLLEREGAPVASETLF